jgi:carboxypeptidase PM20D1
MKKLLTTTLFASTLLLSLHASAQYDSTIHESALLLSQYIQRESVTGNEKEAGEFLASVCKEKGLFVEIFSEEKDSYNFAASLYPLSTGKPNIILLNHIDVVPAGDIATWTVPPFSGTISNNEIWGRGAIDAKGLAIMQLMALLEFKKQADVLDFPYNVTLLAVSEEEGSGLKGTQRVIQEHFKQLNAVLVLGEGGAGVSNLLQHNPDQQVFCVSVCEKQVLWLKLIVDLPSSGHGSVPPNDYANQVMVKTLSRLVSKKQKIEITEANRPMFKSLGALEKGIKKVALKNVTLFKPLLKPVFRKDPQLRALVSNTITLTNISNPEGGTNQIAQKVIASLDCRLLPGTNQQKFIEQIKKSFKRDNIRIEIELETPNASPSSIGSEFYKKLSHAIEEVHTSKVVPIMFPAYTDNNYFRNKGVPVYGIIPVHLPLELMESVHNTDERMPISSLLQGIEVYKSFLNKVLVPNSIVKAY